MLQIEPKFKEKVWRRMEIGHMRIWSLLLHFKVLLKYLCPPPYLLEEGQSVIVVVPAPLRVVQ